MVPASSRYLVRTESYRTCGLYGYSYAVQNNETFKITIVSVMCFTMRLV